MPLDTLAILGAGTMGANIALDLAAHGRTVRLCDPRPEQLETARALIRANAEALRAHGLLEASADDVLARVRFTSKRDEAIAGAELILEAVPERLDLKRALYAELEAAVSPDVILASNTSTFMPTALAEGLRHPERLLVAHYWNPAHLLPLVELVPHAGTRADVLARVETLLRACGKQPVVLRKEVPGFIGNRLAFALQREAMDLVAKGVATPEEIDAVVRGCFGRRVPVTGIFGTADLGGLDVYAAICDSIFPGLCADRSAPEVLTRLVEQGRLGVKTGAGWRDYAPQEAEALRAALGEALIRSAKQDREARA
ncbi:MAG: 3-hydroxyacyl-CoA dehydrogenase family protein [Planctomycetota bacterium]|nr:3-hydroxyacyl-CoA dehydrogenase family protein [Planctomycetota bacterium]